MSGMTESTGTILILLIFLLILMILLIFLYKKLNTEADGKYTIENMVYKEGGIRDRVRGAALAVGTRLGVQLWSDGKTEEDGEEMQEIQDEEGQVENGSRQGSDSEGDDQEDGDDSTNQGDEMTGKEDTSDDDSNDDVIVSRSSKQEEERQLIDQEALKGGTEKDKVEKVGEGQAEASGGAGLLIDLKQFSGSAIWSEEGKGQCGDVTAL